MTLLDVTNKFSLFTGIDTFDYHIFSPALIIFILIFFSSVFIKHSEKQDFLAFDKLKNENLKILIYYGFIIIGAVITIYIIQGLYYKANLDFEVDFIFNISAHDIIWFLVFLFIFIVYILYSNIFFQRIEKIALSFSIRIVYVILSSLILIFLIWMLNIDISYIALFLSIIIYLLVFDLYIEKEQITSMWIFTWMIVISGFTSLIIFSVYHIYNEDRESEELKSRLENRDFEFEKIISNNAVYVLTGYNYFPDTLNKPIGILIERLNTGYFPIEDLLYFNPLNGDYIRQLSDKNDDDIITWINYYKSNSGINKFSNWEDYHFIVIYKNNVLFNNSDFEKIPELMGDKSNGEVEKFIFEKHNFLTYTNRDNVQIISISKIPGFLRPLSLFSLLFALSGIIIFIISLFNSRYRFMPYKWDFTFDGISKLRNRIQFTIIGLLVVSFMTIGIIAYFYILNSAKSQKAGKAQLVFNEVIEDVTDRGANTEKELSDVLLEVEKDKFINFYIYDNNGELQQDKRRSKESGLNIPIGKLEYKNANKYYSKSYKANNRDITIVAAKSPLNDSLLIAGYFPSNQNFNSNASNIISNFLNLYVFLFLIAGVIAIALSNSITLPIEKLGQKLQNLGLNKKNEIINWENSDEIGQLISFYNNAIIKLEESKKIIAKIERDSAWREMAKQVAHEIKNPLTPLKLNIQYMENVVKSYPERASEMVLQISPALIEQIDNLDKIASEFSDFAKMPKAQNEKISLNEIVKIVHDFFRKRDDLNIKLYIPIDDILVFADKNHLVSILNNIIKNAMQAIPDDREGKISIDLFTENSNAVIKITDNGSGIPDSLVDKVFSPNFTTKSSGTGLGLAISTNMIQAFNGKIYFTTEVDVGTSFLWKFL
ncbi:MAG: ATP-binding protein [Saprospiraceae bacterium]